MPETSHEISEIAHLHCLRLPWGAHNAPSALLAAQPITTALPSRLVFVSLAPSLKICTAGRVIPRKITKLPSKEGV